MTKKKKKKLRLLDLRDTFSIINSLLFISCSVSILYNFMQMSKKKYSVVLQESPIEIRVNQIFHRQKWLHNFVLQRYELF